MNVLTHFLGQPIKHADFKRGDLVLIDDGSSIRLALGAQDGDGVCGLILNEWGARYPIEYPTQASTALLSTGERHMRRIDNEVAVEPLELEPAFVFAAHTSDKRNGTLCVLADGRSAIRVRFHEHIGVWNLTTGERVDLRGNPPHYWMTAWRMVWRDGSDAITLCEFGRPAKQA